MLSWDHEFRHPLMDRRTNILAPISHELCETKRFNPEIVTKACVPRSFNNSNALSRMTNRFPHDPGLSSSWGRQNTAGTADSNTDQEQLTCTPAGDQVIAERTFESKQQCNEKATEVQRWSVQTDVQYDDLYCFHFFHAVLLVYKALYRHWLILTIAMRGREQ